MDYRDGVKEILNVKYKDGMAFHSRQDFAKMCGIKTNELRMYIKRGKVIESGEYFNDQLPENIDFLNHRQLVMESKLIASAEGYVKPEPVAAVKVEVEVEKLKPVFVPKITEPVKRAQLIPVIKSAPELDGSVYGANLKKAQVSLSKVEIETKIKELEYEKLLGKNIPTEHVKVVITQLGKSFISNYKDGADSFLTEIGHRKKISSTDMAQLKLLLVEIINRSHEKAIEMAKAAVKNIIDEEH